MKKRIHTRRVIGSLLCCAFAGGCKEPRQPTFELKELKRIEAAPLLAEEEMFFPGQIDLARLTGEDEIVILTGGGAGSLVAFEDGTLVEVCATAGSIRGRGSRVVVGCNSAVSSYVEIVTPAGIEKSIGMDAPSSFAPWPVASPNLGRAVALEDNSVVMVSLEDGSRLWDAPLAHPITHITWPEFSPSGRWVAVPEDGGYVELFDSHDPKAPAVMLAPPKKDAGIAIAFSANEQRVAISSFWGEFRLYSIDGELLASDSAPSDRSGIHDVAYLGDVVLQIEVGRLLVRDRDGKLLTPRNSSSPSPPFGPPNWGSLQHVVTDGKDTVVLVNFDAAIVSKRVDKKPK